ncbi:MAG: DMT family transporter [Gemmobacter sp.]
MRRDRMDAAGAAALVGLALLFAGNQVSIKVVNGGFQPVFAAALRSVLAAACIVLWMRARGIPMAIAPGTVPVGLWMGAAFAAEFVCLYIALDHTTVTRATVFMYTMPMWLAGAAHVLIPGERITPLKAGGLALAFGGIVLAMTDRGSVPEGAEATLLGDGLAILAAMGWAAVALLARAAGGRGVSPEMQLLWMVVVSAPILFLLAPAFGPFLRGPGALEIGVLLFQSSVIVAAGFLAWFWLLARYPAGSVASFAFLSPVFGIALGWALLGEPVGPLLLAAGAAVAGGLVLINWPRAQVPQKVRRTT